MVIEGLEVIATVRKRKIKRNSVRKRNTGSEEYEGKEQNSETGGKEQKGKTGTGKKRSEAGSKESKKR